jgi:hypothetical protein
MSMPTIIKRCDLGNEFCQMLLDMNGAVAIPPHVNDIADTLPWLLQDAPIPLLLTYRVVAVNLGYVCDWSGSIHIHPYDAHFKIASNAMSKVLNQFFSPVIYNDAMNLLRSYFADRWGDGISFAGFKVILLESYQLIIHNFGSGVMYL